MEFFFLLKSILNRSDLYFNVSVKSKLKIKLRIKKLCIEILLRIDLT